MYITVASEDYLEIIEPSIKRAVFNVTEIAHKLIYMSIAKKQIVATIPNKYEKT